MEIKVERRKVKNCRIVVNPDESVKIIAPYGFDVNSLIERKKPWIEKKIREIKELVKEFDERRDYLILNGNFYRLKYGDALRIENETIFAGNTKEIEKWIRKNLRKEMLEKVRFYSRLLGVKYGKVYIRKQKTKWASCSSRGNLSFNIILAALPEELKDYVVIHELTHLIVPKHNRKFWGIVSQYYPKYKKAEEELKRYWFGIERNNVWKMLR